MILDPLFVVHLEKKFGFSIEEERESYKSKMPYTPKSSKDIFDMYVEEIVRESGISKELVLSKSRKRTVTLVRHMIIWLARRNDLATLKTIAEWLGGMDHSTVIHAVGNIDAMLETRYLPAILLKEKIEHLIL
jgi:chromosomal replication initiation ATPase DnaA